MENSVLWKPRGELNFLTSLLELLRLYSTSQNDLNFLCLRQEHLDFIPHFSLDFRAGGRK